MFWDDRVWEDCSALAVHVGEYFCCSPGLRILLVWAIVLKYGSCLLGKHLLC